MFGLAALVTHALFNRCHRLLFAGALHFYVDEADNAALELVLGRFNNDNEFLRALRCQLEVQSFGQFLVGWILNEPACVLKFTVFDQCAILIREGQLVAVVLTKYLIAAESGLLADGEGEVVRLHGDVRQLERRAEDLAADELPVVDDVRVHVKER